MERMRNEFQWNLIVDRIMGIWDSAMSDVSIQELYAKDNIVLIRSVREEVTYGLLELLSNNDYAGNLHLIGRRGDEKYVSEYPGMKIDLFSVDDCEMYSVENTKAHIDRMQADAVCFLYQSKISSNHDNLLRIVECVAFQGYAVSKDLQVVKFDAAKLHSYFRGKAVYDALCEYFYDTK